MDGGLKPGKQRQGRGSPQSSPFNQNLILWLFILFFLIGPVVP